MSWSTTPRSRVHTRTAITSGGTRQSASSHPCQGVEVHKVNTSVGSPSSVICYCCDNNI